MQSSMQKYKKRMLTLSIMLLVIVLLSGVSYAIFTNYASQTDANTLAASCMDLDFNGQNEINLTNTYPVKDGEALEQTPYTFTIKNKCDNYIEYYVIASVINTSNILDSKYVKVSLLGDSDLTSSPITNLETITTPQSLSGYNIINNYILKKGDGISKDESRTFNYRMWVNGDLQDSWTSEDVENKNYQVKISVVGTVKTKPKDDLFIATTIDGTASSTFPETKNYSASVSCTQDNKTVDIGAEMKWTGSKWSLSVSNLTSGNTKCNVTFLETKILKDIILANNEVKEPLTTPGNEVSAHKKDDIIDTVTKGMITTEQGYYVTYGTDWNANGTKFNLTGTTVTTDTYVNSYSNLVGKYLPANSILSSGTSTAGTMVTTTNLDSVYYVVSATSSSYIYKQITSNKNTTEALLASTEDDYGMSYYFRGAVKNNYVQFANKCWRIVRITGDSSVKLVLHNDNTSGSSNPCSSANNNDTAAFAHYNGSIFKSTFNEITTDNTYVGFMYGQAGASNYASTHANTNKSVILTNLESWYTNNLIPYTNKIADTIWCNDKNNVTDTSYVPWGINPNGLGYGTNATYYNPTKRLLSASDTAGGTGPSLKCNGELSKITTKVGLLTADEIAYSGSIYNTYNFSTYLQENTGQNWWWSLSPTAFNDISNRAIVWTAVQGMIKATSVNSSGGVRPTICLISSTTISGGTGTSEDPYVVN